MADEGQGQAARYLQERIVDPAQRLVLMQLLFEVSPLGIVITSDTGVLMEVNDRILELLGYSHDELVGKRFVDITHPEDIQVGLAALKAMMAGTQRTAEFEKRYLHRDGEPVWVALHVTTVPADDAMFFVTYIEDIRQRKRQQQALIESERQREVIVAQRELLRQISAPLIRIADRVIAMPLVGPVDDDRVRQLLEVLLAGVVEHRAAIVIIDVTGVAGVDEAALAELLRAGRAVQLLGAEMVLSGISPAIANGVVRLGVDLGGLRTIGQFQSAIAYALSRTAGRRG